MNLFIKIGLLAGALTACSADPQADAPGTCSLSCGGAHQGVAEMTIKPMFNTTSLDISCNADFAKVNSKTVALNAPLTVRFRVTAKEPGLGTTAGSGSTTSASTLADDGLIDLPRGGVMFEPVLTGILDYASTTTDYRGANNTVSPAKFAGIVTPRSEWCSDTCGIITYEFMPDCVEGVVNTGTASVMSGPADVTGAISYSIKSN